MKTCYGRCRCWLLCDRMVKKFQKTYNILMAVNRIAGDNLNWPRVSGSRTSSDHNNCLMPIVRNDNSQWFLHCQIGFCWFCRVHDNMWLTICPLFFETENISKESPQVDCGWVQSLRNRSAIISETPTKKRKQPGQGPGNVSSHYGPTEIYPLRAFLHFGQRKLQLLILLFLIYILSSAQSSSLIRKGIVEAIVPHVIPT